MFHFTQRWRMLLLTMLCSFSVWSLPVQRGIRRTLVLTDGSTVTAEARGDEHLLFWESDDGQCYVRDSVSGRYQSVDLSSQQAKRHRVVAPETFAELRAKVRRISRQRATGTRAVDKSLLTGGHRGLIILVEFPDRRFDAAHTQAFYARAASEKELSGNGFQGSVSDYFRAQSNGLFDLTFDVRGPVMAKNNHNYYGDNDDAKVGELVKEACEAVDDSIDFSQYDWDGDHVAEEVFILYAGYGQADHPDDDEYIWPHMYHLAGYAGFSASPLVLDETKIDVYACANELTSSNRVAGIGTICHEFSHCLGLPDFYDTSDGGNYGMGSWDLMDYGCYNGQGFTPACYTGYEKMSCGWIKPVEIAADTVVGRMAPLSRYGATYVVRNPDHRDEMYVIDNRQLSGFDAALPGRGLLVTYVDYDQTLWDYNNVNATGYNSRTGLTNDHQRATILHADNREDVYSEKGDAYPYMQNNSITPETKPAVVWREAVGDSQRLFSLLDITQNEDSTMTFRVKFDTVSTSLQQPQDDGVLLYETFDKCQGKGGNDGRFSGIIAKSKFVPDLGGWKGYDAAYGGDRCAYFGNSRSLGTGNVMSPTISLPADTVTLTFRAAGWNAQGDGTDLYLRVDGRALFAESGKAEVKLAMEKGKWNNYIVHIVGQGTASVAFMPSKRFFLDDVKATRPTTTGITGVKHGAASQGAVRYYGLDGRYRGSDWQRLPGGVYVERSATGSRKVGR
jgi:M6 family metalloprotease-like protein